MDARKKQTLVSASRDEGDHKKSLYKAARVFFSHIFFLVRAFGWIERPIKAFDGSKSL